MWHKNNEKTPIPKEIPDGFLLLGKTNDYDYWLITDIEEDEDITKCYYTEEISFTGGSFTDWCLVKKP